MLMLNTLTGFGAGGGHTITNSADFDGSSGYLSRTFAVGDPDLFAISAWVYRDTTGTNSPILEAGTNGLGTQYGFFGFDSTSGGRLRWETWVASYDWILASTAGYAVGSWRHFLLIYDSANGTSADRARAYANGTRITAFDTETQPPSGYDSTYINKNAVHRIGRDFSATNYWDGKMADFMFINGRAPNVSEFIDGAGRPAAPVSFGALDCWLRFNDSGNLGLDSSGNGNNWTVNGSVTQSTSVP